MQCLDASKHLRRKGLSYHPRSFSWEVPEDVSLGLSAEPRLLLSVLFISSRYMSKHAGELRTVAPGGAVTILRCPLIRLLITVIRRDV